MHQGPGLLTNDEKVLDLLRFSLARRRTEAPVYISATPVNKLTFPHEWGGYCLISFDAKWQVYTHDERYVVRERAVHDDVSSAADDLYWRATKAPSIWQMRVTWERRTGLTF